MFHIFYIYVGFFVIYYIIFLITFIYFATVEEWCCKNRIPLWSDKLKQKCHSLKQKYHTIDNRPEEKNRPEEESF